MERSDLGPLGVLVNRLLYLIGLIDPLMDLTVQMNHDGVNTLVPVLFHHLDAPIMSLLQVLLDRFDCIPCDIGFLGLMMYLSKELKDSSNQSNLLIIDTLLPGDLYDHPTLGDIFYYGRLSA
jgi:hypothetical protein